jgi:F0F1-type ATP synthase assembly protein I
MFPFDDKDEPAADERLQMDERSADVEGAPIVETWPDDDRLPVDDPWPDEELLPADLDWDEAGLPPADDNWIGINEPVPVETEWREETPEPRKVVVIEELPYEPPTTQETLRRNGLAWSAGIAFFGSVAFMLMIGWIADLVLGSYPWGMVGSVMIGSLIGFIQFFRLTSQIYGKSNGKSDIRTLTSHEDDDLPPQL